MNKLAPIAYFTYNRPEHTKVSLDALKNNELASHSKIIIFSDSPKTNQDEKKVDEVRKILNDLNGFKEKKIIIREKNYGLYKNFVTGITDVCNEYDKIIVVEDDNKTSKYFLNFINDGLNVYQNEPEVCAINGWFYPNKNDLKETFFLKGGNTWGWGTWKRAWDKFNPNTDYLIKEIKKRNLVKKFNLNNSFDYLSMLEKRDKNLNESHTIIWKASTFLNDMFSLYPSSSFVKNIGFDGSGIHNKKPDKLHEHSYIQEKKIIIQKSDIKENIDAIKFIKKFYRRNRIKNLIKKIMGIF
ncbi:hypothetical protein [Candidatus Pelagibacter communis]|uniref:hypothetical protein n=1 Tax=Pelagibacter ubique TaxID=198252 RepID=UPI00094BF35E|nr:hypothetical protein [Candidatus Pelagibacter ubique]